MKTITDKFNSVLDTQEKFNKVFDDKTFSSIVKHQELMNAALGFHKTLEFPTSSFSQMFKNQSKLSRVFDFNKEFQYILGKGILGSDKFTSLPTTPISQAHKVLDSRTLLDLYSQLFNSKLYALEFNSYFRSSKAKISSDKLYRAINSFEKEIANQTKVDFDEHEKQDVVDVLQGIKSEKTLGEKAKLLLEWFGILCQILMFLGWTPKDIQQFYELEQKIEMLCGKVPELSTRPADVREVNLNQGSLPIRQYDRKKAKIIYRLDNGVRFCVLSQPKGNSPWLKVAVLSDENKTIVGYVQRKFTKKIYLN